MDRKQWVFQLAVVLAVGFIGGALSSRFFPRTVVQTRYMPEQGKVIQAEEFCLVDSQGKPRARLMVEDTGPGLIFFTNQEKRKLEIGVSKYGDPVLNFLEESEKPRISMGVSKNNQAYLGFWDSNRKQRIALYNSPEGESFFAFHDESGEPVLVFHNDLNGNVAFSLLDEKMKPRVGIVSTKHDKAGIVITDKEGDVLWRAP